MSEQEGLEPVHLGEVLAEEFLAPKGLIAVALARHVGLPANPVSKIVAGGRAITGDTALRLAAALGTTAEFWMGWQMRWALAVAARRGWAGFSRSERRATIVARPATKGHPAPPVRPPHGPRPPCGGRARQVAPAGRARPAPQASGDI